MEVVVIGHNFESILPKDHPCHVCFKLADWFQRRKLVNNFMQNVGFCVNIFKDLPLTRLAALRCARGLIRILED
jgi:hypothetical protein